MSNSATLNLNLYKFSSNNIDELQDWPENFMGYKLIVYKPSLFSLPKFGTSFIRNTLLNISTFGNYRIIFLYDDEVFVHYMEIVSKNFRFNFMDRNDILLQQSFTNPSYRGKGIMTNMMKLVFSVCKKDCKSIWGYCFVDNEASAKAIGRAGFEFVSYAKMNLYTKIIRMVNQL